MKISKKMKSKMPKKMVVEAMKYWQKQLISESMPDDENAEVSEVDNDVTAGADEPNTVGAFIKLLQRRCKMDDVILPLDGKHQEMMLIDLYSKRGRAVLEFVPVKKSGIAD